MTKAGPARTFVAAMMVLNQMMKKRQLANFVVKNIKKSKSLNNHRDEFNWKQNCRRSFPTPATFVKFYKRTPTEFDSVRDKITRTSLYNPEVKLTPDLMLSVTLRNLAGF